MLYVCSWSKWRITLNKYLLLMVVLKGPLDLCSDEGLSSGELERRTVYQRGCRSTQYLNTAPVCVRLCSEDVGAQYTTLYPSVKNVYLKLLSLRLRVLVYNGDTDMACNFLGDQWFVEDLGLKVATFSLDILFFFYQNLRKRYFSDDHKVPDMDS